jgi:CelD/BcsL family acetyltransferase involved in cellulose biosynthesis
MQTLAAPQMTVSSRIIDEESDLVRLEPMWDELAVAAGRAFCAPAWMLAWWRHARPSGATLHVVAVEEGERLIGIAPFCTRRAGLATSCEVLTGRLSPPVGPLAAPGREAEVSAAIAAAFAGCRGAGYLQVWDRFDAGDMTRRMVDSWPHRSPWVHTAPGMPAPVIAAAGNDPEAWVQGLGRKVRQEVRRRRRRLEEDGAKFEAIEAENRGPALDALLKLHAERWRERGGSRALVPGLREMLDEAAEQMLPEGRMRLLTITVDGRTVAATMVLAAGEEAVGWLGGFDPAWGGSGVSMILVVHAIEDAIRAGRSIFDLGPGAMAYKRRLADAEREVSGLTIVPRGAGYPLARATLAPYQARWALSERLSPATKDKVRGALARLRSINPAVDPERSQAKVRPPLARSR